MLRLRPRVVLALACASVLLSSACSLPPALKDARRSSPPPTMAPGAAGHIVLGPYVQPGGTDLSTSMTLVWWSDAPGAGTLEWADAARKTGGKVASTRVSYEGWVRHTARVERPDGATALRVLASVSINGKRFTAKQRTVPFAPGPDEALRFAAVGDTGAGNNYQRSIVRQIQNQDVDLLLLTGDDVYDRGDWDEYKRRFFPYYGPLMDTVPILPALGNHDVGNPKHMGQPFRMAWTPPDNFRPPAGAGAYSLFRPRSNRSQGPVPAGQASLRNYSADAGRCHFLCLDSTADRATIERQIIPWAQKDLEDAKRRGQRWLIAYWHHPPYTRGAYRDNRLQWGDIRDLYVPMLRKAGAHLVLLGHDHNYQHMEKDGIHYVITGAGGARLYDVHPEYDKNGQPPLKAHNDSVHSFTLFEQSTGGDTLKVRQIDRTGRQLDAFTLTAR